jgi:hypothetical protein
MQAAKISICDENAVAANSDQAKRNHRLHVKSQEDEEGCKISGHFRAAHAALPSRCPAGAMSRQPDYQV